MVGSHTWSCPWVCGCVGMWVCGCVGVCVCVWVCGCVGMWVGAHLGGGKSYVELPVGVPMVEVSSGRMLATLPLRCNAEDTLSPAPAA